MPANTSRKPLIGVIPLVDDGRESYWMLPGYFHGIEHAGGVPIMLPLTADADVLDQLARELDGLLFTGGHDVDPALYGEPPAGVGETCPARDAMERGLLERALAADKPVFGICRGIQFINAAMGGTLWQDLPTQLHAARPDAPVLEHHMSGPPYDRAAHEVEVLPDTPLAALLGAGTLPVNSYHHQGVRRVAPGLRPMAIAPDGLVEALWAPGARFCWAVQWHPEFMPLDDPAASAVFGAFLQAASAD